MSLIKSIRAQLGMSTTPANNFTLDASADNGTMKLARGNAGATTQDILTVTSGGVVKTPQNLVAFSAYKSSATQSIPSATFERVTFDIEEFDTASAFSLNYRFTPSVAGYYQISGSLNWGGGAAATLLATIYKNGSRAKDGVIQTSGSGPTTTVSALIYMNGSTDYVELFAYQTTGSPLNVINLASGTYFQGILVAAA